MEKREILKRLDHTLLKQTATWEQIRKLCDEGLKYQTASVCIPPCFVRRAKEYVGDHLAICTVIGFPNGNTTTQAKEAEAKEVLEAGADEIDMVINVGMVKEGDYGAVQQEIETLRKISQGKVLKVIIETCYLTGEEKIAMCQAVTKAGADYIKTSTGFGTGGATLEDVRLFREHIGPSVKIKAAGGVKSREDLEMFLEAGCDRIGTSSAVGLLKGEEAGDY